MTFDEFLYQVILAAQARGENGSGAAEKAAVPYAAGDKAYRLAVTPSGTGHASICADDECGGACSTAISV